MRQVKRMKTNQVMRLNERDEERERERGSIFNTIIYGLFRLFSNTLVGSDEEYSDKTSEMQAPVSKYYKYKREFICDFCGLNLSSKQRLLEHLLRHVKYMCQICSERYAFSSFRLNFDMNDIIL